MKNLRKYTTAGKKVLFLVTVSASCYSIEEREVQNIPTYFFRGGNVGVMSSLVSKDVEDSASEDEASQRKVDRGKV